MSLLVNDIFLVSGMQVLVDDGTEACLMLFIQDYFKNLRGNVTCQPYVQTHSREVKFSKFINSL